MKSMIILIISSFFAFVTDCPSKHNENQGGILLLKSGFEEGVSISGNMAGITGTDVPGYSWDATPAWIESSRFTYLVSRGKDISEFMKSYIEEMPGPRGNITRVLCMENIFDDTDHRITSRNEFDIFSKKPPYDYQEGYVRYWMKLQDNLGDIIPFEKEPTFYMIMEWKEPDSGIRMTAEECKACCNAIEAGTNNYRINIGLVKKENSNDFFWTVIGEHPQPCRIAEWTYNSETPIELKFGDWFLVEAYMKKHETDGRVYFAINEKVIFDTNFTRPEGFTGRTQHPENPLPLRFWAPLKNYHSMEWNAKGPVRQWYDDFELWSTFPPDHPALR